MNPNKHTNGAFCSLPAVLLSVWYLFAICGIDIHRDDEHGKVFVVPGFIGGECELIHPGQHCLDSADGAECLDGEDCCSDSFSVVLALGEEPGSPEGFLPATGVFPHPALHSRPVSAAIAVCLPARSANAPPPPGPSVSFPKLSVLRI